MRNTNISVTQIFTLTIMVFLVVKTMTSTDRHLTTKMRSSKQKVKGNKEVEIKK